MQPGPVVSPLLQANTASVANGPFAYVTNRFSKNVSVIDVSSNTVVATIFVGRNPWGIAITPDGTKAYVVNQVSDIQVSGIVRVIDVASNAVIDSLGPVGSQPLDIAITPDGSTAYTTSSISSQMGRIELATGTISSLGIGTTFLLAITPDGTMGYASDAGSDHVLVFDVASNKALAPIPVGRGPCGIAITPDGTRAYVVNNRATPGTVSVIDLTSNAVVESPIPVGNFPCNIAITPDGTTAYVVNAEGNATPGSVSVVDLTSNAVVGAPIPVGNRPWGIAITPDGTTAYVTNRGDNTVSVIDLSSNTVLSSPIPTGTTPVNIAITPAIPPQLDDRGPVTTNSTANPNPVAEGDDSDLDDPDDDDEDDDAPEGGTVDLTANVDEMNAGGSNIASAEYSLDGGLTWSPMSATDGTFDEVSEDVAVSFGAPPEEGIYDLCVRGTDDQSNVGVPECIPLVVSEVDDEDEGGEEHDDDGSPQDDGN